MLKQIPFWQHELEMHPLQKANRRLHAGLVASMALNAALILRRVYHG